MVNRPPPKPGASGRGDEGASAADLSTRSVSGPRQGLEWSLRSLHSIDTGSQHFLSTTYESSEHHTGADQQQQHDPDQQQQPPIVLPDQTAYEIFKTPQGAVVQNNANRTVVQNAHNERRQDPVWAALHAPLRVGVVDGKKVVFELKSEVTHNNSSSSSRPPTTISRQERLRKVRLAVNADQSPLETRMRFYLMHFSLMKLSVVFLGAFIAVNVVFALLFYYGTPETHCCGDSTMTFGDVFSFCVQTSTTIGYGSFSPVGTVSNLLVVILSYVSTLMNTLFAGLLFTRFVTPVINIQFSEVMTLCNVNGVPCLSFRLGNADGMANPLTDINVRLTYSFEIPYTDHKGEQKFFRQTEELKLLSNRQFGLTEVWTLRHVVDESSPLFGLHLEEHPGNKIYVFTISIDAVQDLTKSSVNVQTEYGLEDIMIGYTFKSIHHVSAASPTSSTTLPIVFDNDRSKSTSPTTTTDETSNSSSSSRAAISVEDYADLSATEPNPVWYPAKTGVYETQERSPVKEFKP